ncbi:phosphatidylserine/phosphatidylglycerophosphate/cardiolipin synthase family protein [Buttiauxella sp. A111]|uniref:phospholipase D-like domain-containing protein n=1 Tax=Buttiauxella sp. A111 TaxID=2563088 RepID=UPI0010DB7DFA|nr:phospholipase D-like domain-containing protein [Buttiauxella sp. A111]GDX04423.1 phospholipase [Buttiauxella sp. A111]
MSQHEVVSPVATVDTDQCTITPPWFVQDTEYHPTQATYMPLVNGEEAFKAVHEAIANAKKSVDIICWGFQPSMYFIRDGKEPCIGELLKNIAKEKKVEVRILGWEMPLNSSGVAGEANLPGKGPISIKDKAGQTSTDEQYAFDREWYREHSYESKLQGVSSAGMNILGGKETRDEKAINKILTETPVFAGRGFNAKNRTEIAYQTSYQSADPNLSVSAISTMAGTVTHHQKTVLVDYELPEDAVGFVMGHNMLDEYWDTDGHSSQKRPGTSDDRWAPNLGPRGKLPRQDMSSRVTGPILEHLHENFATAWRRATGQDLLTMRNAKEVAKQLKPRADLGTPIMAQLLRTQVQEGKRDIEKLYLKTVNNVTQFIYIENQYFRWPPLAEAIKKHVSTLFENGRDPKKHGYVHLFVVTNVTDEGIGAGTVNTQRMLESLGRADTIPNVTKQLKIAEVLKQLPTVYYDPMNPNNRSREAEIIKEINDIEDSKIAEVNITGLKVHICSLVAPDSPENNWMPVYIHSKLMIINDVFTTHGSANINTRSMQVDSEMNIAHEWADVTKALRQRLWNLHTNGIGVQDEPDKAFKAWEYLLGKNEALQAKGKYTPEASLIKFLYNPVTLTDLD